MTTLRADGIARGAPARLAAHLPLRSVRQDRLSRFRARPEWRLDVLQSLRVRYAASGATTLGGDASTCGEAGGSVLESILAGVFLIAVARWALGGRGHRRAHGRDFSARAVDVVTNPLDPLGCPGAAPAAGRGGAAGLSAAICGLFSLDGFPGTA
jgi:hypothetical protein